jgi:hypothetical protein
LTVRHSNNLARSRPQFLNRKKTKKRAFMFTFFRKPIYFTPPNRANINFCWTDPIPREAGGEIRTRSFHVKWLGVLKC